MNILVVAAHPDDEILGVGGALAKHTSKGDKVSVLILAEGLTSRGGTVSADEVEKLKQISIKANSVLGIASVSFAGLSDNRMDSYDLLDVVKIVEEKIEQLKPEIIYTHFPNDLNVDHRIAAEAVVTATRTQPGCVVQEVLFFETVSSTHWETPSNEVFRAQVFIDITDHLSKKIEALKVYECEMRSWPHARSLEAVEYLAKWRGSLAGKEAAEAFQVGRILR